MDNSQQFSILGRQVRQPMKALETFPAPSKVQVVSLTSEEFTSLCPITGQPDFQTVLIEYRPNAVCLESKSLKLYLWSFREEGVFCEALSQQIAEEIFDVLKPRWIQVTISQNPRGGIAIQSIAHIEGNRS